MEWIQCINLCARKCSAGFFRSNTRPHPPRRSRYNRCAVLFYSSDGTLNLGHHLDRENRPHIQGRWWAGMVSVCVCVCGMGRGVRNWFPYSAWRGEPNKANLSTEHSSNRFLFLFFFTILLLLLTSRIHCISTSSSSDLIQESK